MEPVYKTSMLFCKVEVYPEYVKYKTPIGEIVIPMNQISHIDTLMPGVQKLIIETTGGKKINIPVGFRDKSDLAKAIIGEMTKK